MKMLKAVKKLKFWSKNKRKKKHSSHDPYFDYHYQLPSTYHQSTYHHHSYSCTSSSSSSFSAQPSAPALPPWLEQELTHEPSWVQSAPEEELVYTSQATHTQFTCQETNPMLHPTLLPGESTPSSYMDPNPVYGLPVLQRNSSNIERKSTGGVFGYFVKFGLNLVGCFCPCLSIREAHHEYDRLNCAQPRKNHESAL